MKDIDLRDQGDHFLAVIKENSRLSVQHYFWKSRPDDMSELHGFCIEHKLMIPDEAKAEPPPPPGDDPVLKALREHQVMLESLAAVFGGSTTAPGAFKTSLMRARRAFSALGVSLPRQDPDLVHRMQKQAELIRR